MRQLGLFLIGTILISAAIGGFAYRHLLGAEQVSATAPAAEKSRHVRTVLMRGSEISYPIDAAREPTGAPETTTAAKSSSIDMLNFIFNLLNVVVGFMGVWFAAASLRGDQSASNSDGAARAA